MYGGPGGLMSLEPVNPPAAAGPCALGTSPPQQIYSRQSTFHQPQLSMSPVVPASDPASALAVSSRPTSRPASQTTWQNAQLHQQQQPQPLLYDAPMSPWRGELPAAAATAVSGSPLTRRSSVNGVIGGGSYTAVRPRPSATLDMLIHSGGGDDGNGDAEYDNEMHADLDLDLPSMVPDEQAILARQPSSRLASTTNRARMASGLILGGLESGQAPGSPGGRLPRGADSLTPATSYAARDVPLLPSTPSGSHVRSLRATSVVTALPLSGSSSFVSPQAPLSPLSYYASARADTGTGGGGSAVVSLTSSGAIPNKASYKAQVQRLRVAVSALDGGGEGFPDMGFNGDDDYKDDNDFGLGDGRPSGGGGSANGPSRKLRSQQFSGGLGLEDALSVRRAASTLAWLPIADSPTGNLDSGAAKPSPGSKSMSVSGGGVGFSRRPEDLPAAPSPANSRSLTGGCAGSSRGSSGTPGTAGSGRALLAWQPSINSSACSSSIGFSRRPEDLPAAPSPSNSRSLAGGDRHIGASTPGSPAGPGSAGGAGFGGGSVSSLGFQRLLQPQQRPVPTSSGGAMAGGATDAALVPSSTTTLHASSQLHPHLQLSPTPRGGLISANGSILASVSSHPPASAGGPLAGMSSISSGSSSRGIRVTSAASNSSTVAPTASPPAQRPSASGSVGFSRRPEELPAAPSPANSRSLAGGGAGSSASSTRSAAGGLRGELAPADSPRAPSSPAAWASSSDAAATRGPLGRRLEDLPAAPPPSQSRSLRLESARTVFRSHAGGGTGGGGGLRTAAGMSPVPLPPMAWAPAPAGGGGFSGLHMSLGSPSPSSYAAGGQQQRAAVGPQGGMSGEVGKLPVLNGDTVEDLSD